MQTSEHRRLARTNGRHSDAILRALEREDVDRTELADAAGLGQSDCARALRVLLDDGQVLERDGAFSLPLDAEDAGPAQVENDRPGAKDQPAVEFRVRVMEKRSYGPDGFKREIGAPPMDDSVPRSMIAASLADQDERYREERAKLGLAPELRKARRRAPKQEALRDFVLEHGSGVDACERWRALCDAEGYPQQWRYANRQSFNKAATKLLRDRSLRSKQEMLLAMGLVHREELEDEHGRVTYVFR